MLIFAIHRYAKTKVLEGMPVYLNAVVEAL